MVLWRIFGLDSKAWKVQHKPHRMFRSFRKCVHFYNDLTMLRKKNWVSVVQSFTSAGRRKETVENWNGKYIRIFLNPPGWCPIADSILEVWSPIKVWNKFSCWHRCENLLFLNPLFNAQLYLWSLSLVYWWCFIKVLISHFLRVIMRKKKKVWHP